MVDYIYAIRDKESGLYVPKGNRVFRGKRKSPVEADTFKREGYAKQCVTMKNKKRRRNGKQPIEYEIVRFRLKEESKTYYK